MKLIIKEYLLMLKESKELDALLPPLLLQMGWTVIGEPQIGVRQFGVDIEARGIDPDDGLEKIFIFVVKCGNINRSNWDSGLPQDIRPTLNEIKDTYRKHLDIPKKIIVCTTGMLQQDLDQNWAGYKSDVTQNWDGFEVDIWNINDLTIKIEEYLLNNQVLFDNEQQSLFRKTLALIGENDYDIQHFYRLLEVVLFSDDKIKSVQNNTIKKLKTLNLLLHILYHWGKSENNLKNVILASERSLLWGWHLLEKQNLIAKKQAIREFNKLFKTYLEIGWSYFHKVKDELKILYGLTSYCNQSPSLNSSILTTYSVYEQLGIISTLGILTQTYELSVDIDFRENLKELEDTIDEMLINNPACCSPLFDDQHIEIGIYCIMKSFLSQKTTSKDYFSGFIYKIAFRLPWAYGLNAAPLSHRDYADLFIYRNNASNQAEQKELTNASVLISFISDIGLSLDNKDIFNYLAHHYKTSYSHVTLQRWYMDQATKEKLFYQNANDTGKAYPISSDYIEDMDFDIIDKGAFNVKSLDDYIKQIRFFINKDNVIKHDELSSWKAGYYFLELLASRHFRTVLNPSYWHILI